MKDKYFISIGSSSLDQKSVTDISLYVRRVESDRDYWKNVATALAMETAIRDGVDSDDIINQMDNKTIHMIIEDYNAQCKRDAEDWKELAKGLYDYYYLGEGHSQVVREYERKTYGE